MKADKEKSSLERNSVVGTKDEEIRKIVGRTKGEEMRKIVERTKHKLEIGKYLFPNAVNHPYIGRACLAVHRVDNTLCLVLYQDKINANGMSAAMKGLNEAASVLHDEMKIPVLCVAQVIGASLHTTSQNDFEHPYILIRDDEVSQFYTPTFAPALRFVRQPLLLVTVKREEVSRFFSYLISSRNFSCLNHASPRVSPLQTSTPYGTTGSP